MELLLIIVTVAFGFSLESSLPILLQEYQQQYAEAEPTLTEIIALSIGAIASIFYISSLVGIIFHKLWARKLFIISTIVIYPIIFFIGPNVDHAVTYTFDQLSTLVQGMLLAFLGFGNSYQESFKQ